MAPGIPSQKPIFVIALFLVLLTLLAGGCAPVDETPPAAVNATPAPSWTPSPSATASVTPSATPKLTRTPVPSMTPTATKFIIPKADPSLAPIYITEFGKGAIVCFDRTPDNRFLLVGTNDGQVLIFDTSTQTEVKSIVIRNRDDNYVGNFVFSRDSRFVLIETQINLEVVDLPSLEVIARFERTQDRREHHTNFVFSPDNRYLVFSEIYWSYTDYNVTEEFIGVWDLTTQDYVGYDADTDRFVVPFAAKNNRLSPPKISPDSKFVASGYSDNQVYIWYLDSGETHLVLPGHVAPVLSVDFSPTGRYLASAGEDGTIRLWNPQTGTLDRIITGFSDSVANIEFSPDGRYLFVDVRGQGEFTYDLITDQKTRMNEPEPTPDPLMVDLFISGYSRGGFLSNEVLFNPDGTLLAVADKDILLWDLASEEVLKVLYNPVDELIQSMIFDPMSRRVAAVTYYGYVLVWKLVDGQSGTDFYPDLIIEPHPDADGYLSGTRQVAFSSDGKYLASGNGISIEVWDVQENKIFNYMRMKRFQALPQALVFQKMIICFIVIPIHITA